MPEVSLIQRAMLKRLQRQSEVQQTSSGSEAFGSPKSNTMKPEEIFEDNFFQGTVVNE